MSDGGHNAAGYFILFDDGRNSPITLDNLSSLCEDGVSWLNFLRMVTHPGTFAEMFIYPRGQQRMTLRVIREADRTPRSSFDRPFGGG